MIKKVLLEEVTFYLRTKEVTQVESEEEGFQGVGIAEVKDFR